MSNEKERPKLQKVIKGNAGVKKQSNIGKIAGNMITDNIEGAKNHIIYDILIPSAKSFVLESVKSILGIGGQPGMGYRNPSQTVTYNRPSYTNYSNAYNTQRVNAAPLNQGIQYDNLVVNSKAEADDVLAALNDAIGRYGLVTVGILYQLVGRADYPYVYDNYGWMNIASAYPVANLDGTWSFKLPRAVPIQ